MPVMGPAVAALSGAALGAAASGAIGGALADLGIEDDFMKELAANLEPGNAALFSTCPEDDHRQVTRRY
jgi:uncharacterized membrane protein